jgi:hypothetical protein
MDSPPTAPGANPKTAVAAADRAMEEDVKAKKVCESCSMHWHAVGYTVLVLVPKIPSEREPLARAPLAYPHS